MKAEKSGGKVLPVLFRFFVVVFAAGGLFMLQGLSEGLEPWVQGFMATSPLPDEIRFHAAAHGAMIGILFSLTLLALLKNPQSKPVLLRFYFVGHFIFLGTLTATDPSLALQSAFVFVMFAVVLLVLYGTYGQRREIFRPSEPVVLNRPLLLLNGIALLGLLPVMVIGVVKQFQDPVQQFRWGEVTALSLNLLYGGYLSASGRNGSRTLGIVVGITYAFMGAAAITIPNHPGSWGLWGGLAAVVFGIVYTAAAWRLAEARKEASLPPAAQIR